MSMLQSLKSEEGVKVAAETDSIGGGSRIYESGLIPFTVGMAYTEKSKGGALGLFLTLVDENKKELKQTLWMTSGDTKGNKTYYTKDDVNYPLPGFSRASELALLTTGKEISELDTEEKVVKIYNFDTKSEVPTKVQVVMELIGASIIAGVVKQTVDKNTKDAGGNYIPSGETRDENDIDKFFCAKDEYLNYTPTEIKAKAEKAEFFQAWADKNTGVTRKKAKGVAAEGTAGAPKAAAAGTPKPKTSLFGGD